MRQDRRVESGPNATLNSSELISMPLWRKIYATTVISVILGTESYCIFFHRQLWPFVSYPMYAKPMRNTPQTFGRFYVMFVDQHGSMEKPDARRRNLWDGYRINVAMRRLSREGKEREVPGFLKAVLADYRTKRRNLLLESDIGADNVARDWPDYRVLRLYESQYPEWNERLLFKPGDRLVYEIKE